MDYPASVANVGLVNGKFANENPSAGIVGSLIPAEWGNAVTDELVAIIKAANLTPSEADSAQVLTAIRILSQRGDARYAADTGTATAYKAAFKPEISTLTDGMLLYIRAGNGNTGPAPTLAVDKLAAKAIVKGANKALAVGDIQAAALMAVVYDKTNDVWVLLNPSTGVNTVTAVNDPGFLDDSDRPISSGWLRRGMSTLAFIAGFEASWGVNGYVKLPDWLGGFIMQWGSIAATNATTVTANYPIRFPRAFYGMIQSIYNDTAGSTDAVRRTTSANPLVNMLFRITNADGGTSVSYWAFGR